MAVEAELFRMRRQAAESLLAAAVAANASRHVAAAVAASLFRLVLASDDLHMPGDDMFEERVDVVRKSMSIHRQDCRELGFGVHKAANAAVLIGGTSLEEKLHAHRLAGTAKHE